MYNVSQVTENIVALRAWGLQEESGGVLGNVYQPALGGEQKA